MFREDIRRAKPHPDGILQALAAMPRQPDADDVIWFIGDRQKDVMAAVAAAKQLPCPIEPLAYNLHAAMAILNLGAGLPVFIGPAIVGLFIGSIGSEGVAWTLAILYFISAVLTRFITLPQSEPVAEQAFIVKNDI